MPGGVAVQDAPAIVRDDEETVDQSEGQRWYDEEVHCDDRFPVIAEKRRPALSRARIPWSSAHPPQDGSFGDLEAEHPELAMNPRRTPRGVLGHHAEDDLAEFLAYTFSADDGAGAGEPPPIELEAGSVPADDRLRLDNHQRLLSAGPEPPQQNPEELVVVSESWLRMPRV
jgi:hypothetical protein